MTSNIDLSILNSSPAGFAIHCTGGKFAYPNHLALIDKAITFGIDQGLKLIVNMPPRHGKSELISKYLPAWYLLNHPNHRVILAGYDTSFAVTWGRKVMDVIRTQSLLPINSIATDSHSVHSFLLDGYTGGMDCVGVGGPITGKGANLLIIDDPIKNDAEANSPHQRDILWEWFLSTIYTRLEPDGSLILVMTRWHEDDLTGRIINSSIEGWRHISLPAIATGSDELDRNIGTPLWSQRYTLNKLNEIRATIGDYWFSSLYQQSPSPASGAIFRKEHFRYFTRENSTIKLFEKSGMPLKSISSSDIRVFATIDLAATIGERSDYTVAMIFGISPIGEIIILEIYRVRLKAAEHLQFVKQINFEHSPILIGIESVQYQISLVQQALSEGLPVVSLMPDKDKFSRALPMAAKLAMGIVFFRKQADWLFEFEKELMAFPNGSHDDQVDAFAYINSMLPQSFAPAIASVKRRKPDGIHQHSE